MPHQTPWPQRPAFAETLSCPPSAFSSHPVRCSRPVLFASPREGDKFLWQHPRSRIWMWRVSRALSVVPPVFYQYPTASRHFLDPGWSRGYVAGWKGCHFLPRVSLIVRIKICSISFSVTVCALQNSLVVSSRLMHHQTMDFLPRLFRWILRKTSPHSPQNTMFEKQL